MYADALEGNFTAHRRLRTLFASCKHVRAQERHESAILCIEKTVCVSRRRQQFLPVYKGATGNLFIIMQRI